MQSRQAVQAVLYCRTSVAVAEPALVNCVDQAERLAAMLGLQFDGSPDTIGSMIRENLSNQGDVYVDMAPAGGLSSRPGLKALYRRACEDQTVPVVMVPDLNRLSRDPAELVRLLCDWHSRGWTIILMEDRCEDRI